MLTIVPAKIKHNKILKLANKNLIKNDTIEYVIQINGKKRATIKSMKNISEKELIIKIMNNI